MSDMEIYHQFFSDRVHLSPPMLASHGQRGKTFLGGFGHQELQGHESWASHAFSRGAVHLPS